MNCPSCATALPDGVRFCWKCGAPVGGAPADHFCPTCGAPNQSDALRCENCHEELVAAARPAQPAATDLVARPLAGADPDAPPLRPARPTTGMRGQTGVAFVTVLGLGVAALLTLALADVVLGRMGGSSAPARARNATATAPVASTQPAERSGAPGGASAAIATRATGGVANPAQPAPTPALPPTEAPASLPTLTGASTPIPRPSPGVLASPTATTARILTEPEAVAQVLPSTVRVQAGNSVGSGIVLGVSGGSGERRVVVTNAHVVVAACGAPAVKDQARQIVAERQRVAAVETMTGLFEAQQAAESRATAVALGGQLTATTLASSVQQTATAAASVQVGETATASAAQVAARETPAPIIAAATVAAARDAAKVQATAIVEADHRAQTLAAQATATAQVNAAQARANAEADRASSLACQQRRDAAAHHVFPCSAAATIASNTKSLPDAIATAPAEQSASPAGSCRDTPTSH